MDRRSLLKNIALVPLVPIALKLGAETYQAKAVAPGEYLIFYDVRAIDPEGFVFGGLDPAFEQVESWFIPVRLGHGQTLDDVIKTAKVTRAHGDQVPLPITTNEPHPASAAGIALYKERFPNVRCGWCGNLGCNGIPCDGG